MTVRSETVTLVGGGLVGSLLATGLAKRGFDVELFERRSDPRTAAVYGGRSINLAVSVRGIHALKSLGLDQEVLSEGIAMKGRVMHAVDGTLTYQPYGVEDWQCIYSISRGNLNRQLLTAAEGTARVKIHFESKLKQVQAPPSSDQHALELVFENDRTGEVSRVVRNRVFGTDGSASALRGAVVAATRGRCSEVGLDYGYKELLIAPREGVAGDERFKMEKHALHIWPRGKFMMIALPNFDGSFTCTLFLPYEGEFSFQALQTPQQVRKFFEAYFADTLPLLEDLEGTFFSNPTGHMVTVKTHPWNWDSRAILLGDAAHAIVPFFGQGMNCGFEDCSELLERMDAVMEGLKSPDPEAAWCSLFNALSEARWQNADAIADMAVENFLEMRDKVGDQGFLAEKALEKRLQQRFPKEYISRYSLVSFSRVPYKIALHAGEVQNQFLKSVCDAGKNPAEMNIDSLHSRIQREIAPILMPYLPDGLKNGYQ